MGLETEYGILGAEPEDVVAACLEAESEQGRCPGVRWDYSGEYPLRDARGFEVDRSAVDPSMLTDVSGTASVEGPVPGRLRTTVVARLLPYWQSTIVPEVKTGKTVLIAAHGNSLRAIVKHLDDISDADIAGVNIPTGIPLVYELDEKTLKPVKKGGTYLDPEAEAKIAAVANQGK